MNSQKLLEIIIEELDLEDKGINMDSVFDSREYDSFAKMNLIITLETYTDEEISIIELLECCTFGEIIALVIKEEEFHAD